MFLRGIFMVALAATSLKAVADDTKIDYQDIFNLEYASDPRITPDGKSVVYVRNSMDIMTDSTRANIWTVGLDGKGHKPILSGKANYRMPRFSPDGNKVIMSLAENGNSDIYVMDLPTRKVTRLTDDPGIDTSPSYSPDGKHIVFNSDRGGSQQLYVMNADGSGVHRISFGRGRYATPVWSPRGDLIAFTKIGEHKFRIGVMRPDGKGERLLTNAYQDEGPTWSPNGRVLMFFRTSKYDNKGGGGHPRLWSVDLTGYNERQVPTPYDASDPAWSPPLPVTKK